MANEGTAANDKMDLGASVNGLAEGHKVFGNHYTLIKIVGRSANTVVWLAWDEKAQRDVALKFLPEATREDPSALAVLKREFSKLKELKHPALVQVYDVEGDGPLVAIVYEYVEGASLADVRAASKDKILPPTELAEYIKQLRSLLEYGHNEGGRVFGALTPRNLLLSSKGVFKVQDFASSWLTNEYIARVTEGRAFNHNLSYASPQIAMGEAITPLDDIYAFGATAYELLTSKPPFYTGDLMLQINQKIPPPMTHRRKELRVIGEPIPRVWEEAVAACLSKAPAARPQSMALVMDMLGIQPDPEAVAAAPIQVAPPPPAQGSGKMVMVAGAVGVVLLGVIGLLLGKSGSGGKGEVKTVTKTVTDPALIAKQKEAEEKAKKLQAEIDLRTQADKNRRQGESERTKQAELERKKAADEAAQLRAELEKARKDEAKRQADAEETAKKMAAIAQKANADAEKAKKEVEDARKKMELENSAAAQKLQREAEAKANALLAEANKKLADLTKAQEAEKQRIADQEKKAAAATTKAQAAEEKNRMLQLALEKAKQEQDPKKLQEAALAAARAKAALDEQRIADAKAAEKKRQDDELASKKQALLTEAARRDAEAKKQAELAARQFHPGTPFVNSLGMRMMPIGKVSLCAWETRVEDFEAFVLATRYNAGSGWKPSGYKTGASIPVAAVSWDDAQNFCKWLTDKERKEGILTTQTYRLPKDTEWSTAVKLDNEPGSNPAEKDGKVQGVYPWGTQWPPPPNAGNYADTVLIDRYDEAAPVGSFAPNGLGFYDLGGNVLEWCDDWFDGTAKNRVLRGGSWQGYLPGSLNASYRRYAAPTERRIDIGFRIALE